MTGRLVFLDIDGTLCDSSKRIPPSAVEAIRTARTNGCRVFIDTGRALPQIGRHILDIGFDGIISSAGARIDINGTLLQDRFLDKTTVTQAADMFDRLGINHLWQSSRGLWASPGYLRLIERIRRDIDPGYGATNGGPSRSHDRTPHDRACPWARSCRHRNARSTPHPTPRSPSTRSAGSSAIGCTSSKDPWASTRPPTERA